MTEGKSPVHVLKSGRDRRGKMVVKDWRGKKCDGFPSEGKEKKERPQTRTEGRWSGSQYRDSYSGSEIRENRFRDPLDKVKPPALKKCARRLGEEALGGANNSGRSGERDNFFA